MKKNTVTAFMLLAMGLGAGLTVKAQTASQRAEIIKDYDLNALKELELEYAAKSKAEKKEALEMAAQKGWKVTFVDEDGAFNELMRVSASGRPVYYQTDNKGSARTSRVNKINTGGGDGLDLNGQDMIVGIWDGGGVRSSHQDLELRVEYKDGVAFDTPSENTGHATHVAGTMISSGIDPNARGLAYQANLWGNDWNSDTSEAASEAAQGLLASNHSYGLNIDQIDTWVKGAYITESRAWDNVMFNAPYYQPVFSAGNDRGSAQDVEAGMDLLTDKATAKNGIVVAAVLQVSSYVNASSVHMSTFSSWGPTDDFRIKPDISTKGVSVYSTYADSNTSYETLQGTSMASPGITGALILMQQHYHNLYNVFMRAATLKGLMTNSADEAGDADGPDYMFGWGLINAERAVNIITNKGTSTIIDELNLLSGQTYTRTVEAADGAGLLKATIAWTDPTKIANVNNGTEDDPTPVLNNDLDIRVTKGDEVNFPWKLDPEALSFGAVKGDNTVDNIESVEVPAAVGTYTITITHKGTALQNGHQNYSLIVNGLKNVTAGIKTNSFEKFSIAPNPASNFVELYLQSANSGDINVVIYDLQGRAVKNIKYTGGSLYNEKIDVSGLASGMYIFNVSQGDYMATQKIVIK